MMEDDGLLTDPEKFTFTYRLRDDTYELYDEQQILYPSQSLLHIGFKEAYCLYIQSTASGSPYMVTNVYRM